MRDLVRDRRLQGLANVTGHCALIARCTEMLQRDGRRRSISELWSIEIKVRTVKWSKRCTCLSPSLSSGISSNLTEGRERREANMSEREPLHLSLDNLVTSVLFHIDE